MSPYKASVVHKRCPGKKYKIFIRGLLARSLQGAPGKLRVQDPYAMFLYNFFFMRSQHKFSRRVFLARFVQQDLCRKSLYKIEVSWEDPDTNSLGGLLARFLCGISRFVPACAIEMRMDISREPFDTRICRKNAAPQKFRTFCASLRCRNAHGHATRTISCGHLQGTCRMLPIPCLSTSVPYHLSQEPFQFDLATLFGE